MPPPADPRPSLHVYNARCALTVEPTRNRRGDVHTVNLETAARAGATGDFDWAGKTVVQVTGAELPDVLAVLLGYVPEVEFRYHGAARDKGYRFFRDGPRLVLQTFAGGDGRHSVALAPGDRLRVAALLFRQLQRNHGGLAADVLHAMHASVYAGGAPPVPATPPGTTGAAPGPADGRPAAVSRHGAEPDGRERAGDAAGRDPDGETRRDDEPDAYDW